MFQYSQEAVCLIPYLLNWVLGLGVAAPASRCFGKMFVSTTSSSLALLQKSTQDLWGHSISQTGEVVKCVTYPKVLVRVRRSTMGQASHRAIPRASGFLVINYTLQEDVYGTNGAQMSLSCFHSGNDEDVVSAASYVGSDGFSASYSCVGLKMYICK